MRTVTWHHERMNVPDVPDDATAGLVEAAEGNAGSLSAFVVDRFTEAGQLKGFVASYRPPPDSGITSDDAIAAVQEV